LLNKVKRAQEYLWK